MKITTGVDIIEVERVKEAIESLGNNFLNRIYTENEIIYCNKSSNVKYQHFAARFAAKEAVFKALSTEITSRDDLLWKQIEVINDESGRPMINIERLQEEEKLKGLISIDVSISHIKEYAIASVVTMFE